jgi:outer membrane protein TolC
VAGLSILGQGCSEFAVSVDVPAPPVVCEKPVLSEKPVVQQVSAPAPADPAPSREVPLTLDTVLHLAEQQNAQVGLARARVREAYASVDVANKSWLPRIDVGGSYFRHEGGLADFEGNLVHSSFGVLFGGMEIDGKLDLREAVYARVNAERSVWQQKGELRRVTSETLLDASTSYVDLLAARNGEAIALSMQKDLQTLLQDARNRASVEPGANVEVARVEAQLKGIERTLVEMREQQARLSAKLTYLLGMEPCVHLVPVDEQLVAFEIVDATPPACDLVARALSVGPGIREMDGLLALIHDSMERAKGPGRFIPVFEMTALEGAFGTGPGDDMRWDNRFDLGLQARWNLTQLFTAKDEQRVLQARIDQAHLAYQDLRGKLAAGVAESREAIIRGSEQMRLSQEQIDQARRAYQLSDQRWVNRVEGSSASEVLLSLQTLSSAQASYLGAMREYDKAQLRLMVLIGPTNGPVPGEGNCSPHCGKAQ